MIGSILGVILSKICVEPKIQDFFGKYAIDNNEIKYKTAFDLYKEALDILNLTESSTTEMIKRARFNYLASFHPDKSGNQLEDKELQKFMKLERSFRIIESYRKDTNKW